MAEAKGLFFNLSGTLQGKTCRERNGKTILYDKPGPYNRDPENQKNCIIPKGKFRHAVWFSTFNNSIPLLKKIWKNAHIEGLDAFHRMIKYNINNSDADHLTEKNIISPPGMRLEVKEVSIKDFTINTQLEIEDNSLSVPFQAVVVVYAYNPGSENKKDSLLFALTQEISESTDERVFNITLSPDPDYINAMNKYQNWIMYFTLIKDDPPKLIWTSTASFAGETETGVQDMGGSTNPDISKLLFCDPCNYAVTIYRNSSPANTSGV